ncbi:hypothetical protein ACFQ2K_03630 [Streptomyces sanglieri]|uniref:Uncharacterized protein n=1 Tax=Streptomyces sanglieri TaxID=193460 RepID=A0ABW2WN69_9ACTN
MTEPGESAPADDSLLALARREKTDPLAARAAGTASPSAMSAW